MERSNLIRNVLLFAGASLWVFLLLSLASFHATDWPSHAVYPHPTTRNLCGSVGAFVAYYCFLAIGQGVFPLLFFTGVCLVLLTFQSRIGDLWMRAIGLALLSIAFAAAVHHFKPGSPTGFPEGQGGIVGIGAASFLQNHFNTVGTRLILLSTVLIGLLLAADDLVLRTPGMVSYAYSSVRAHAPRLNMPSLAIAMPRLPSVASLPWFGERIEAQRPATAVKPLKARKLVITEPASDPAAKPGGKKAGASAAVAAQAVQAVVAAETPWDDPDVDDAPIEISYHDDEPAPAREAAFQDDADPGPAEAAVIPPPEQRAVPKPPATASAGTGVAASTDDADPDDAEGAGPAAPAAPAAPAIRRDIVVKLPNMLKPRQVAPPAPPMELGEYQLPGWDCLDEAEHGYAESQESFVRQQAAMLEQALKEFDIDAHVTEIDTGPVITMYEIALAPGIKVSAISALSNDIQRSLRAESVRIVAPIPGKNTVGIEVPNEQKEKVRFKELMQLAPDSASKMAIPLFLGKDASGEPLITDLAAMPHALIAGTTGSGKSVCINTIIMSILYKQRPDMVKLVLFDPKVVEMAMYKDIPHLMCPVINDASKATSVLEWACEKMDERYEFLAEAGVRNIAGYNKLTQEELIERFKPATPEEEAKIPKKLPYIVIIIDELADLMMTSGKEVESSIVRIAQKARAVGIHLILATQRPSANVVTGLIKSNMPTRIAFRVQSKMDSRIVLDQNGADLLLGHGDMLFLPPGASKPTRSQGTFIDDKEVRESVKLVKAMAQAQYEPELVQIRSAGNVDDEAARDELFDDAVKCVLETKRGSVSLLQRRLTIGYSRASRLIEAMASAGILGDYKGSQARECNITIDDWEAMKAARQNDEASGMTV
jgi:S-DNA-T family DNA segregation ATPase FtsK/SpoIIIE